MEIKFTGQKTRNNNEPLLDTHRDTHKVFRCRNYISVYRTVLKILAEMVAGRGFEPLTFGL